MPCSLPSANIAVWTKGPPDIEASEVDADNAGGNHQADSRGGPTPIGGEIVGEFIRARLTDRLALRDLDRSFSRIACLRATTRRKDYRPKGEHNWEKGC
jgi:hypothetical protein